MTAVGSKGDGGRRKNHPSYTRRWSPSNSMVALRYDGRISGTTCTTYVFRNIGTTKIREGCYKRWSICSLPDKPVTAQLDQNNLL